MPKNIRSKALRKRIDQQVFCDQNQWYEGIQTQSASNQIKTFQCRRDQAIELLANKNIPQNFLYRDKQIDEIDSFITNSLTDKVNFRILLVTGSPGAGKTLSVNSVLKKRQQKYLKFNANVIKSIKDIQNFIYEQLIYDNGGKQIGALQIIRQIQKQWLINKQIEPQSKSCIIFIEQIQLLFKSASELLVSDFLAMFCQKNLHLILIGTSNSIDFLEKYEDRTNSKMPVIKNVVFRPYNYLMIKQILTQKIALMKQKTLIDIDFPQKLLIFACKKIENVKKGDLRFALQFFRTIIWELLYKNYNQQSQKQVINMQLINRSFHKLNDAKDSLIISLPFQQQMLLIAFYIHIKRTQAIEITARDLSNDLKWICDCLKINMKKQYLNGLTQLGDYGFISKRLKHGSQRIFLKLSLSDIQISFYEHTVFGKFFQAQDTKIQ